MNWEGGRRGCDLGAPSRCNFLGVVMTAVNQLSRIVILATLAAAQWSCGGGGGEPTGTTQPPPPPEEPTVASVTISGGTSANLAGTLLLTATAATSSGATVSTTFSWSSSDNSLATVDGSGVVTGVERGSVTITATASGTSISGTHSVTVTVASVSVTPASATLASLGEQLAVSAEARDANGAVVADVPITYTSSDLTVATVAAVVNNVGFVISVSDGVATITAGADDKTAEMTVTVAQVATTTLLISPAMATLVSLGETVNFTATAADALANAITSGFTWQTGDGSVATVSSTSDVGGVTSVGNGSTTVTVSRDGMAVSSDVVVQQAVSSVAVSPGSATLLEDFTQQLSADPQDANGNTVAAATVSSWASSNDAVATVDDTGLVTGVVPGSATITATADAVQGTAQITVEVVTLTNHVQPIFTSNCALSNCHIAPNPQQGQDLSTGQAWSNIVNVPAVQLPTMNRVTPGDTTQSYLFHKIAGTQVTVGGSGSRMPRGLPALSSQDIAIISSWITKGALDN